MSQEFITVEDAKSNGLIPSAFHPYFADKCEWCGAPMQINDMCTILKCGNPGCYRRVGNQAAALLKDLGYKGYGPQTLTSYCTYMGISSILDFLLKPLPPLEPLKDLNNLNPTFPTLLEMLHIPNLGSKAHKIFATYDSLVEAIEDKGGVDEFFTYVVSVMGGYESASQFIQTLQDYFDVICSITDYVKVASQAAQTILVEITGHITRVRGDNGETLTKDAYIRALNNMARPLGIEFVRSSKFTQLQFIIADSPSNSRKYLIGAERGILVTSDNLLATVSKMLSTENSQEDSHD